MLIEQYLLLESAIYMTKTLQQAINCLVLAMVTAHHPKYLS